MKSPMPNIFSVVNLIERLTNISHGSPSSTPLSSSLDQSTSYTPPHGPPPIDYASSLHVFAPSTDPPTSTPHFFASSTSNPLHHPFPPPHVCKKYNDPPMHSLHMCFHHPCPILLLLLPLTSTLGQFSNNLRMPFCHHNVISTMKEKTSFSLHHLHHNYDIQVFITI
jgi:hypothetical protein